MRRLLGAHPRAILVHTPVHASWLDQVEIYFSMVQRKVFTPNDFIDLVRSSRVCGFTRNWPTANPGRSSGSSPSPTWSICYDACRRSTKPRHCPKASRIPLRRTTLQLFMPRTT